MTQTHIVMIHGLASKPESAVLFERYKRYVRESVGRDIPDDQFRLAYWADLMGYVPADGPERDEYVEGGNNFRPYTWKENIKLAVRGEVRNQAVQRLESRFAASLVATEGENGQRSSALAALPHWLAGGPARRIYKRFLPDMRRYFFDGKRDATRGRLAEQLDAVPDDANVCLIAHSMGSIIALDLILAGTRRIDTLITIGSPLGMEVVKEQLELTEEARASISATVGDWFNLYDRLDVVALDTDLADDFAPMPVLDVRIRNEFLNKDGDRNYHKSYGYLRSPELGEIVGELL